MKSTSASTSRNSLKRMNTTLLDSSDLRVCGKQTIIEKKRKIIDKSSNSTSPLINFNDVDDNDQSSSAKTCKSMLFNNEY